MDLRTLTRFLGGGIVAVFLASGYAVLQAQLPGVPQQNCGGEHEAPCPFVGDDFPCDNGLVRSLPTKCGCLVNGPFGGCLIPRLCTTCESGTRRRPAVDVF